MSRNVRRPDNSRYLPLEVCQSVSTLTIRAAWIMEILSNLHARLYRVALLSRSRSTRREQIAREILNGFYFHTANGNVKAQFDLESGSYCVGGEGEQ